jgi:hypothetical protein
LKRRQTLWTKAEQALRLDLTIAHVDAGLTQNATERKSAPQQFVQGTPSIARRKDALAEQMKPADIILFEINFAPCLLPEASILRVTRREAGLSPRTVGTTVAHTPGLLT